MRSMEPPPRPPSAFGFYLSPLTPPHVPDVLICRVDPGSKYLGLVAALSSDATPVSTHNLSRWLFLLARASSSVRPIRPPAVYRSITFVGADIFTRFLAGIGPETFPCDSPDPLPPGCYALFVGGEPYPHPFGQRTPRSSFAKTERNWDVPDDDFLAAYRMAKSIPDNLASGARKRDRGMCCFTGRPSDCVTWVLPPLLRDAVAPPTFSLEQCLCFDNVFTISPDLLQAYQDNQIAVDPQDKYRVVVFGDFSGITLLNRLRSAPSSSRFWHASLSWTLAVRFAGCDLGPRISSETRDLFEELCADGAHTIPQEKKWTTPAGEEAIRVYFWVRSGCPLPSQQILTCDNPPASPSGSNSSSSDTAVSDLCDTDDAHGLSHSPISSHPIFWVLFPAWWIFVLVYLARICMAN
ncbi:hypothetical protein C8R45DRAFT_1017437 [Mycena sanguinolenta]|nr:hypothetical protein C8R45DRAFT_1017437 [Mycena sanguinolenta]